MESKRRKKATTVVVENGGEGREEAKNNERGERDEQKRNLCSALIASGKNKGSVCNRPLCADERFCRYHVKAEVSKGEARSRGEESKEEERSKGKEEPPRGQANGFDGQRFLQDLKVLAAAMKPLSDWLESQRVFTHALIINNDNGANKDK